MQEQLDVVVEELTLMKKQREDKEAAKRKRAERRRKPQRQPVTPEIYQMMITHVYAQTYKAARLRIAFCLLVVTGVRISELLPLNSSKLILL